MSASTETMSIDTFEATDVNDEFEFAVATQAATTDPEVCGAREIDHYRYRPLYPRLRVNSFHTVFISILLIFTMVMAFVDAPVPKAVVYDDSDYLANNDYQTVLFNDNRPNEIILSGIYLRRSDHL